MNVTAIRPEQLVAGGWLHADADTLKDRAEKSGWHCDVLILEPDGNYLAMLKRR